MASVGRIRNLTQQVREVLEEISGQDVSADPPEISFIEQGFDSLILTQVALACTKRFGANVKLRHLVDETPSCEALVQYLDQHVKPGLFEDSDESTGSAASAFAEPSPVASSLPDSAQIQQLHARAPLPSSFTAFPAVDAGGDAVERLIQQQLAVMARQLEVLGAAPVLSHPLSPQVTAPSPQVTTPPQATLQAEPGKGSKEPEAKPYRHGPQLVIRKGKGAALTPQQEKHIDETIRLYVEKTSGSKAFTQKNRSTVADPRTASGFHARLKEAVYPIVARRSSGCRIWDVNGNEYVDMLSGYGSNFFGFGAPFIKEAMSAQMDEGMEIGPQTYLVEEVAQLFLSFVPHFERAAFCNTGSEAVLATFRLARTVVGRDLIVMFEGGYHGMFDEVVVRPTPKRSMPAAPGIPRAAVDNILVLPWNDPKSLEIIRQRESEIAGVIVEPVQSRAPHVQPAQFLKDLRQLTTEIGAALIFDEVVCGFRVAPGGGQEYFGIEADMASYGKVVGGGISIGIVGGSKKFLDALDGGGWNYGDESTPEVGVTYFAGTFVRHPLHMAAARAALLYMKQEGPELQKRVSQTAANFAEEMNAFFQSQRAPVKIRHFASVMKIAVDEEIPFGELFFYHLRLNGVHVWDGRPCFMTMVHGPSEVALIQEAFRKSVLAMQEGGFFPLPVGAPLATSAQSSDLSAAPPVAGARLGRDPDGTPAWFITDPERPGKYLRVGAPS